tara:strand:+ start:1319 stop:1585 length:267 start_codon:yes stop_codon:yes gene_type:complete
MITDNRGYSKKIILANKEASEKSVGVQLGRYCISRDISVAEIADYFRVTRMTIYGWFDGTWIPALKHEEKIIEMLKNGGWDVNQQGAE